MGFDQGWKPGLVGFGGTALLFGLYLSLLTFLSGWDFTRGQISQFWPYLLTLAGGFGVQLGLFVYLRELRRQQSGKIVAVSGTTSTAAMASCCAHYLVNLLPFLGAAGVVTLISSYQIQLFWLGIASNFLGIVYLTSKVAKVTSS